MASPSGPYRRLDQRVFCEKMSKKCGPVKIRFRFKSQQLLDGDQTSTTTQRLAPRQSLPLSNVLRSYHFSRRMRIVVGHALARSMWQHYDSEWCRDMWSLESIQFMVEDRGPAVDWPAITCKPCLTVHFAESNCTVEERTKLPYVQHRYPRILSLGLLLLELGRGKYDESSSQRTLFSEEDINDGCCLIQDERLENSSWPHFGPMDPAS